LLSDTNQNDVKNINLRFIFNKNSEKTMKINGFHMNGSYPGGNKKDGKRKSDTNSTENQSWD
jgi:hypothetical protein